MGTSSTPGHGRQAGARNVLRALGLLMAPLGVVLVAVGFVRFATGEWIGGGAPPGFLMFGLGAVVAVVGFGFLNAGFMGATARYAAGETMPVVKDSASYLTDGEGVLGVGRTVDDRADDRVGDRAGENPGAGATAGPYCRSCGVRNDQEARFCDGCGSSLA